MNNRNNDVMNYMIASSTYYSFWAERSMMPPMRFPNFLELPASAANGHRLDIVPLDDNQEAIVKQLAGPHGKALMYVYAHKRGLLNAKT